MNSVSKLKVLVAHNEPLLAAGLHAALLQQDEFDVSAMAFSPESLAAAAHDLVDVVLADCKTGIHLARSARSGRPAARPHVVIITQDDSEVSIRNAMEAGVRGYLLGGATPHSVVQAVRCAARGGIALDPIAATRLLDNLNGDSITRRELEVLRLVMEGCPDKVIASRLGITLGTVKCHVKRLLTKLDASSRTEAAAIAQRRGLVTPQRSEPRAIDTEPADARARAIDRRALRSRLAESPFTATRA